MKRAVVVLIGVATVILAVVLASSSSTPEDASEPAASDTKSTEVAKPTLPPPSPPPPPKAKFDRTIYATSTLERSELMLDFCRGPIAIGLGDGRPVLVAEHDFCGGSAWIPKLEIGQAVKLRGDGVKRGTYVVTAIEHEVRGKAEVRDLPPRMSFSRPA